jgi:hypothetical protein
MERLRKRNSEAQKTPEKLLTKSNGCAIIQRLKQASEKSEDT